MTYQHTPVLLSSVLSLSLCCSLLLGCSSDGQEGFSSSSRDASSDRHSPEDAGPGRDGSLDTGPETSTDGNGPDVGTEDSATDAPGQDGSAQDAQSDGSTDAQSDAPADSHVPDGSSTDAQPDTSGSCGGTGQPCCAGYKCSLGNVCTPRGCEDAIQPTSACSGSGPKARFVKEDAPPSQVEPWQTFLATVTFANCSGEIWKGTAASAATGYKLGSEAPKDNDRWGMGRIQLPTDVPPNHQVTIPIVARAPALTGPWGFSWAIVHEGVEWLDQASPRHVVNVEAPARTATICSGTQADIGGHTSASAALQHCIDATPAGGTLALPAGIYSITSELHIDKPITLTTQGTKGIQRSCLDPGGPRCAVLRGASGLNTTRGMVRVGKTHDVVFDHIVLDGNRGARLGGPAAQACQGGNNGPGFNASSSECTNCAFVYSGSARAVCGTGFEWNGDKARIEHSVFRDNGDHDTHMLWADGLTIHRSNGAVVTGNKFIDNSDVGFIIGGGTHATIQDNQIIQVQQSAFAGLMLDNFNGGTTGDFTGTVVSNNRVFCPGLRCDFGIELGPHPWYLSRNIIGGTVKNNDVSGAKFQIMVEGGGTASKPITVTANKMGPSPRSAKFNCGNKPTTQFNVSPDSHVNVGSGPQPTGHMTHHQCP